MHTYVCALLHSSLPLQRRFFFPLYLMWHRKQNMCSTNTPVIRCGFRGSLTGFLECMHIQFHNAAFSSTFVWYFLFVVDRIGVCCWCCLSVATSPVRSNDDDDFPRLIAHLEEILYEALRVFCSGALCIWEDRHRHSLRKIADYDTWGIDRAVVDSTSFSHAVTVCYT